MRPRPEQPPPGPPVASALWPLVLLLGEIAVRVEREQAEGRTGARPASEPIAAGASAGRRALGAQFRPRGAAEG